MKRYPDVQSLDTQRRGHMVRCVYRIGALAVTEAVYAFESKRSEKAWRVTHVPTGASFPGGDRTAAECRKIADALAPITDWSALKSIDAVQKMPRELRSRVREVLGIPEPKPADPHSCGGER